MPILRWLVFTLFVPIWFTSQAIIVLLSITAGGEHDAQFKSTMAPNVYELYKQLVFLGPEFLILNTIILILFIFTFDPRIIKKNILIIIEDFKKLKK